LRKPPRIKKGGAGFRRPPPPPAKGGNPPPSKATPPENETDPYPATRQRGLSPVARPSVPKKRARPRIGWPHPMECRTKSWPVGQRGRAPRPTKMRARRLISSRATVSKRFRGEQAGKPKKKKKPKKKRGDQTPPSRPPSCPRRSKAGGHTWGDWQGRITAGEGSPDFQEWPTADDGSGDRK